jgi:hypothetical protein
MYIKIPVCNSMIHVFTQLWNTNHLIEYLNYNIADCRPADAMTMTRDEIFVPGIRVLRIPGGGHSLGFMNYRVSRTNTMYYCFKLKLHTMIVNLYLSPLSSLPLSHHTKSFPSRWPYTLLTTSHCNTHLCSLSIFQLSLLPITNCHKSPSGRHWKTRDSQGSSQAPVPHVFLFKMSLPISTQDNTRSKLATLMTIVAPWRTMLNYN